MPTVELVKKSDMALIRTCDSLLSVGQTGSEARELHSTPAEPFPPLSELIVRAESALKLEAFPRQDRPDLEPLTAEKRDIYRRVVSDFVSQAKRLSGH